MCGIFGFVSKDEKEASKTLTDGLEKLDYRGYDSAGIAVLSEGKIKVQKSVGTLPDFRKRFCSNADNLNGCLGISQTRWATHGGVTDGNAHPHLSCDGKIAVVHNGIITNYAKLKEELLQGGHSFSSETDTEVIPHLIEDETKRGKNLFDAVMLASRKLDGSFAFLAICSSSPSEIIAVKNESPLVIGFSENTIFAASDAFPLAKHVKNVIYMDDGEIAVLTHEKTSFFSISNGKEKLKKTVPLEISIESSEKGIHEHFMLKEILEQPRAILGAISQEKEILEFASEMNSAKGIMIIASGTSLHSAMVAQYVLDKFSNKHVNVISASEFPYLEHSLAKGSLVISVSQSGETADVLSALKTIKKKGAKVFSIVNVKNSTMARMSDKAILTNAGPEIAVASTKAFSAQLAVFYLIAYALNGNLKNGIEKLREVSSLLQECIDANLEHSKKTARSIASCSSVYFLGRGANFPIALEGALKMKEISYLHAEGMPSGDLKHGTLALVENGTPVIFISPSDEAHSDSLSNVIETKSRGAKIFAVSNRNEKIYDELFLIPSIDNDIFYPLLSIIPLQLLAYFTAVERGKNPDKPRNLAKSVTVK